MKKNFLLLSIHPEYANKIFNGTKTVELRRIRPRKIGVGDLVLIYVSSPVKALVGYFEVKKIVEALPDELWNKVSSEAGLDRVQFDNYYYGASTGIGIYLQKLKKLEKPLNLSELKNTWNNFSPPQCFRYLNSEDLNLIGLKNFR